MLAHLPTGPELLRLAAQAMTLLLTFLGAGLYFRGFYVYFRTASWLRREEQLPLRKRYKSSALAVILKEPALSPAKSQILAAAAGPILFAIGGVMFNSLQHMRL